MRDCTWVGNKMLNAKSTTHRSKARAHATPRSANATATAPMPLSTGIGGAMSDESVSALLIAFDNATLALVALAATGVGALAASRRCRIESNGHTHAIMAHTWPHASDHSARAMLPIDGDAGGGDDDDKAAAPDMGKRRRAAAAAVGAMVGATVEFIDRRGANQPASGDGDTKDESRNATSSPH